MAVTLNLPPDVEQAYLAEAQAKGVPVDQLLRDFLIAGQPNPSCSPDQGSLERLNDGMWALRSSQPISVETVNEVIETLRRERDSGNPGL